MRWAPVPQDGSGRGGWAISNLTPMTKFTTKKKKKIILEDWRNDKIHYKKKTHTHLTFTVWLDHIPTGRRGRYFLFSDDDTVA